MLKERERVNGRRGRHSRRGKGVRNVLTAGMQGVLAGVPFFDEVFAQLDCV